MQSLCIAEDYGVLDFIENIAFIVHHEGGVAVGGVTPQHDKNLKSIDIKQKPSVEKERSSTLIVNNLFMVGSCKDGTSVAGSLPSQFDKTALTKSLITGGSRTSTTHGNESTGQSMTSNSNDDVTSDDVTNDDVITNDDFIINDDVITNNDNESNDGNESTGQSMTNDDVTNDDVITSTTSDWNNDVGGAITSNNVDRTDEEDLVKSKAVDRHHGYQAAERRGMMYYGMISGTFNS